jgi:hypothetical protein
MKPEEVRRLRNLWQAQGSPPCEHALVETEDDPGAPTGKKACLTCGAYVMDSQPSRSGGQVRAAGVLERKGYRRHKNLVTWHFCSNCSQWPKTDYNFSVSHPGDENFCSECLSRATIGTCA